MAPSKRKSAWYRRAVTFASCASWLFVSSCASQLPSGDQRRNSGLNGLTASEAQQASIAAQVFSSGQLRRVGSVSDDVSVSPVAEQRLRAVAARYRGRDNLSVAEEAELVAAARPVVVPLAIQEARQQGESAYIIPARSIRTFTFPAYCLDRGIPAPKAGEPLQLVSAETLFPPKLLPLYQGLLRNAAQGRGRDNLTQGLVWNLRQFATGTDKTPITLSPDQEQAVAAADPNGPAIFADYAQQGFIQKLGEDAFNELLNQARSAAGFSRLPPEFTRLVNVSNKQALSNVEQSMRAILSQPSFGGSVGEDQGYTLLASGLAAYATNVGRLDGVRVEVANEASGPAVFKPDGCTGDPGYKAQHVGIQANVPLSPNPRGRRASIEFTPWNGEKPSALSAVFWRDQGKAKSLVRPVATIIEIAPVFGVITGLTLYGLSQPRAQKTTASIIASCRNFFNSDSDQSNAPPAQTRVSPSGQVSSPIGPEEPDENGNPRGKNPQSLNIGDKIAGQMTGRGWDAQSIQDTADSPYAQRPALNRANGNPSTAYFNFDGSYIVRDNVTSDVVQVSNRFDPNWQPDSTILNPYRPLK